MEKKNAPVLCVDLDGTLIRTDLLLETMLIVLTRKPWILPLVMFSLVRFGKAAMKRVLAVHTTLDVTTLPFNESVVGLVRKWGEEGGKTVLISASDETLVKRVASHMGVFDESFGSNPACNLRGRRKGRFIEERYGSGTVTYVGNDFTDFAVWEVSQDAIVVHHNSRFIDSVSKRFPVRAVLRERACMGSALIKALRVHQWVKNILVFVPALLAHQILEFSSLLVAFIAFAAFSLCASAVYVLNDLVDIEADRRHAYKKDRPFASGALSITVAWVLIPALLLAGGILGSLVTIDFLFVLATYLGLTTIYSLKAKQIVLVDIILLASLYTIRLVAGAVATGTPVSQWLFAFSMFIFFSLACVKRFSELLVLRQTEQKSAEGRGYLAADLECISHFGSASGCISILVLALYINSIEVASLYARPFLLWGICPLLFYWLSRVWLLAFRGSMHDDPIVFALEDRTSYIVGVLLVFCILLAI